MSRTVIFLSRPTSTFPCEVPVGRVSTTSALSLPASNRVACTSHERSPIGWLCTVSPVHVPFQIVPSASVQVIPELGPGNAQLAGNRATTIPANTSTANKMSQIVRFIAAPWRARFVSSLLAQHDGRVHDTRGARGVDAGAIHADATLLGQAGQPGNHGIERCLFHTHLDSARAAGLAAGKGFPEARLARGSVNDDNQ